MTGVVNKNRLWMFNGLMLWGALLGVLIFGTASKLIETANHRGPGVITSGEGDELRTVSEEDYRRHQFTMDGMLLLLELGAWIWVADTARKRSSKGS